MQLLVTCFSLISVSLCFNTSVFCLFSNRSFQVSSLPALDSKFRSIHEPIIGFWLACCAIVDSSSPPFTMGDGRDGFAESSMPSSKDCFPKGARIRFNSSSIFDASVFVFLSWANNNCSASGPIHASLVFEGAWIYESIASEDRECNEVSFSGK